jgi:hypothetical protein
MIGPSNRRTYFGNKVNENPMLHTVYMMDKDKRSWRFVPDGRWFAEDIEDKLEDEIPKILSFIDKGIDLTILITLRI